MTNMFIRTNPGNYTLKELSYEKWLSGLIHAAGITDNVKKVSVMRRASQALSRYLDRPVTEDERQAVYDYMTDEIGEVALMNKLNMTKLEKSYLWPIMPSITGYIAGNINEQQLKEECRNFYYKILV